MNRGLWYGLTAYGIWGFLPLYWKALSDVPAIEILCHRMVWSLVFVAGLLLYRQRWSWLQQLRNGRIIATFVAAAALLSVNWFVYIWAVNVGHVVETSLGYFINPLVNVALGVLFFRESLRRGQWIAVALAVLGVLYLTITYGALPWISLTLAFSFGIYGLLKKRAQLPALEGLSLETALLSGPALIYLLWVSYNGGGDFGHVDAATTLLLIGSGAATAIPLLCFAAAAQRIPLSVLGFLQYLAPTIQFILGIFLFNEPFTATRLIGFSIIWLALLVYTLEGLSVRRQRLPRPAST